MKRETRLVATIVLGWICCWQAIAQEKGTWRAASTTARGITGDLAFGNEKIAINFASFPLAQIRELKPAEISALFPLQGSPSGSGNLYRLDVPADKKFLHKNTLCGSEDAQWIATYVEGRDLQMAIFSGEAMPVLTPEAIPTSSNLCGTFAYVR